MNSTVIVGGGAAGFFAAITCAECHPSDPPILLEKGSQLLAKVRISGGGRCNVTHECFDPARLVTYYPRGSKALRGPFSRFQPRDTVAWFQSRGVSLKTESDGRMFPVTDSSQTIIDCLQAAAKDAGVLVRCQNGVEGLMRMPDGGFQLQLAGGREMHCRRLLIATGSNRLVWQWLQDIGHTIVPAVPSLFTFNVPSSPLVELSGVAVEKAEVSLIGTALKQMGPVLITHWGFSGPAVLRLSAWGARELFDCNYQTTMRMNWVPDLTVDQLRREFAQLRAQDAGRTVSADALFGLPRKLWKTFVAAAGIEVGQRYATVTNQQLARLTQRLHEDQYTIDGKTTHKDEFVTCGGVALDEVNFRTMESRVCPGLYFAGEVLDIDGITGGFNFQAAWTTGYLAGQALGSALS